MVLEQPFACTWLQKEDRTPLVRLQANPNYWDSGRGPHLKEILFRNDLAPREALRLVCDTEGEVDLVTEVSPADAARVKQSQHAKLVVGEPMRVIVGILNRDDGAEVLKTQSGRLALNYAIDRDSLVRDAMFGHAKPLGSLAPPSVSTFLHRIAPYGYLPHQAAKLWREAGGTADDSIRIAAPPEFEALARQTAAQLSEIPGLTPTVRIYAPSETLEPSAPPHNPDETTRLGHSALGAKRSSCRCTPAGISPDFCWRNGRVLRRSGDSRIRNALQTASGRNIPNRDGAHVLFDRSLRLRAGVGVVSLCSRSALCGEQSRSFHPL